MNTYPITAWLTDRAVLWGGKSRIVEVALSIERCK